MKRLELHYFENIERAYQDGSAASCNWADARIREIQDYLMEKNSLEIIDNGKTTVISTINDIIEWKKNKNLPSVSFAIKIDNILIIKKLNADINRYQVCDLAVNDTINEFSKMINLNFSLASVAGNSFNVRFKDVSYTSINANSSIRVSDLKFRLAYSNEINALKKKVNIEGKICIALVYRKRESINTDFIVCRVLEK